MKSAAALYKSGLNGQAAENKYYDRRSGLAEEEYMERLRTSTTLYVGNLSFFTLESQLLEYFSSCGQVVNLIMGLNRVKMQPCGFCFVEYATRDEAALAVNSLNRSMLDGRVIRVDWDYGFEPHRQFGRGRAGGQVRDEVRANAQQANPSGSGRQSQDTQMRDADRPLVSYSHAKRDYSNHHRRRDGDSGPRHYNNNRQGGEDGGDGDGRQHNRYHSHHGGSRGGYGGEGGYNQRGGDRGNFSRKRSYRDHQNSSRYGGDNDNNGEGGGYRGHHNNHHGGGGGYGNHHHNRGSTTSADNHNNDNGGNYRDYDSEQMGIMSKRRRTGATFGGDFMDGGQSSQQQQMPGNPMFAAGQKGMSGQQQANPSAAGMQPNF